MFVELYVIYHGLILAKDMEIDEIVCYFDSLYCFNLAKGPNVKHHIHVVLIQDIKKLFSHDNVTVCHILKKGNKCVDFLAKFGASSITNHFIYASP